MHLRVRIQSKNVIYIQMFWVCIMLWLKSALHFPSAISYLTDIFLIYALVKCVGKFQMNIKITQAQSLCVVIGLLLLSSVVGMLYNGSPFPLYLWGLRNNGRFYLFFLCCIVLLERIDIDKISKMLRVFFWLNFLIVEFQYFFQGIDGDNAGGIFGNEKGCNAYMNVFLCIVCSFQIARYLTNRVGLSIFAMYVSCSFVLAFVAELKVFYVEFLIMLAVAVIVKKPTLKTIGILIIGVLGVGIGILLLNEYNPESLGILTDSDSRETYLAGEGYTNSGDLNRFTAIATIGQLFLNKKLLLLFGLGLGSCDTSSISFLQSDFYEIYGDLHYRWFSHAWTYLEQGAVGLCLCISFFVVILVWMLRRKKVKRYDLWLGTFSFLPTCLVGMIYNNALQMETSYMMAFVCAIPFVLMKEKYGNRSIAQL